MTPDETYAALVAGLESATVTADMDDAAIYEALVGGLGSAPVTPAEVGTALEESR